MVTEADTCRKLIVPRLQAAGWDDAPCAIQEQRTFTDGRVMFVGGQPRRGQKKRADYILRYRSDYPIAVIEAKAGYRSAQDGVQQARDYAEVLGLRFAYASNGHEIIEIDMAAGTEVVRADFPTPSELWTRLRDRLDLAEPAAERVLEPGFPDADRPLRYYQEIAVNRSLEAIHGGQRRLLLNLCTGAGKTAVAFQINWRLWSAAWNKRGDHRRPKILFLADRNILVDDPKDKTFTPFGDARWKLGAGAVSHGRDIYFSTYQAIAADERRPGLYREFARDFFDLIVIDECHRGSARSDSSWREILEWFEPAYQLGMTATPLREESRDTYRYFGNALYTYSLAQGIADGFLAPYRVHRIVTDLDAVGWRPSAGELDRFGRAVPDEEYQTRDFERTVALRARTEAIARHLTDFMKNTDRYAKTIVFCVDQDHASEMRAALVRLNADMVARHPDYVARVTADEGDIGKAMLGRFQDVEADTPVILTTSQLLTTGVDAPTCKNVVLARVVGSMAEFKQIIGRGTRMREDYGKLWFSILDYTGTATEKFADPSFDGEPSAETMTEIDETGEIVTTETVEDEAPDNEAPDQQPSGPTDVPPDDEDDGLPRKFYVDGGEVEVVAHMVYDLDADGKRLTCRKLTDWTGEKVRTLFATPAAFRAEWAMPDKRSAVIDALAERGIDLHALAQEAGRPNDDPFDLICHLAWNAPLTTRAERARRVRDTDLFGKYGNDARAILDALLDRYARGGAEELVLPQALKVQPISDFGNPSEIARRFGGPQAMRQAVDALNQALYAA